MILQQALPRRVSDERVLERRARDPLQRDIVQILVANGAQVLHRHLGAEHTLVVRGQRDRHTVPQVEPQRVVLTLDTEDGRIARQVDLDEHVVARHALQQRRRILLERDGDAMSDALRTRHLDGVADVEAHPLRRHQPGSQLTGVQRNAYVGIERPQESDHLHVQRVVAHRDRMVLRLHEVQPDHARVRMRDLEGRQDLREHGLRLERPRDAVQVTHRHVAARGRPRLRPLHCRGPRLRRLHPRRLHCRCTGAAQ
jgi:hypothetical protein